MGVRTAIIFFSFSLLTNLAKAQVYNYLPLSYENVELNPAIVARTKSNNGVLAAHTQALDGSLSSSMLQYAHYFKSNFTGVGICANRIAYSGRHQIHSGGIAMGYRTILGDRVTLRLGAMFRHANSLSNNNTFEYYSITRHQATSFNRSHQFFNWSMMLGEPDVANYAFFGMQNITAPWNTKDTLHRFGSQMTWEIGNLLPALGGRPTSRLTYSGAKRMMPDREVFEHYINLRTSLMHISRKLSTLIGGRVGWSQDDYLHLAPALTFFTEWYACVLAYNHHLPTEGATAPPSSIQLSFTYLLH